MRITVHHRIDRDDLALGVVALEGVEVGEAPRSLQDELEQCIAQRRAQPLSAHEEAVRTGSRDILRNGTYKPTGRGKPASEYLLRAASEEFPRINGPVDANNLVSLKYCVAISVWDIDLAGTEEYEFRLGRPDEHYVFNPAGQVLELASLVCGCGLVDGSSRPMVTPVKDSMATKLREGSTRICGAIYFPSKVMPRAAMEQVTQEFLRHLASCGARARGRSALCVSRESVSLEVA